MNRRNFTFYDLLFGILIVIAFGFRVVFSGHWHLSEKEAAMVLSAASEPNTIYQVWTNFLFTFFKDSEFFARILPVLFGTFIVGLPLLLRKHLGDGISLILAIGLTFDPGLIALSKQAGPEIMAISAFLAFLIFLYEKKWIPAGIFLSIGLLSGYQFWIGTIAFFLCAGFALLFQPKSQENNTSDEVVLNLKAMFSGINWKELFTSVGITLLIGGTLFFYRPQTLAGIASGIVDFFIRENPGFYSISVSSLLIGLVVSYGSLFVLGLLGSWKISASWRGFIWQWVLIVFILISVFPNRQLADYIWMVLPLYYPAAKYLSELKMKSNENQLIVFGGAIALSMLLLFSSYSLMHYINSVADPMNNSESLRYLLSTIIAFVVFVLVIIIIGWGWSLDVSHDLFMYILVGGLLLFSFIPSMRSTGFGAVPQNLMWLRTTYFPDADLFTKTITQLEQNRLKKAETLKIQLQGIESDSMLWELRKYDISRKSPNYSGDVSNPDVIISGIESAPQVSENRMGQDLIFNSAASWSLMTTREYLDWALGAAPLFSNQEGIVWADLYEGSLEVITEPLPDENPLEQ